EANDVLIRIVGPLFKSHIRGRGRARGSGWNGCHDTVIGICNRRGSAWRRLRGSRRGRDRRRRFGGGEVLWALLGWCHGGGVPRDWTLRDRESGWVAGQMPQEPAATYWQAQSGLNDFPFLSYLTP